MLRISSECDFLLRESHEVVLNYERLSKGLVPVASLHRAKAKFGTNRICIGINPGTAPRNATTGDSSALGAGEKGHELMKKPVKEAISSAAGMRKINPSCSEEKAFLPL